VRKAWNGRGIFTVTQLSYTFRPRRSSKRHVQRPLKHDPALKALAVRKSQIHVVGMPSWTELVNPVYFDVEGVPDREFYYLIGLRHKVGDQHVQLSFWADGPSDERTMWAACLRALRKINTPRLVHYGSYETQFLRRMKARYDDSAHSDLVNYLASSAINVLSFTYAQIYFPTYSNTLKDIGHTLGFRWSDSNASGLKALVSRLEWERSRKPHHLQC